MVQNMVANKFKLQGDISKYQFELLIKNGQVPSGTKPTLQIYERTNVI